ncbi:MAG: peptidoglycan editing factor PgeF [Proteobacteria bacterium]|nr:peptidoglycan editing factor PgeF [Pseudomonadota bacterium]
MFVVTASNLRTSIITHGFFGRQGGVSSGIFASLNCGPGSGDERAHVIENRRRARETLGASDLVNVHQIHSPLAIVVSAPWELGQGPQADAMATDVPGLALGILTADCAPILFADADAGVIGAAHAGWKGALGGIVESTVRKMEKLGASRARIAAAIGPCISQKNYEVGPEFHARFAEAGAANGRFFVASDRADHWRFDLESFVAAQFVAAGIKNVQVLGACTYARDSEFFSFRRATHRGEKDYGRQLSAILLKA